MNFSRIFFVFIVIVCFHSSEVKALHCYQGKTMTENGIESALLLPCANIANSCVRQDDLVTRMTHIGCMAGNCTDEQGQYSPEPICKKMSQSPYLLTCCCYGDGCNGNQDDTKYKVVHEKPMPEPIPINGLRCYQGQTWIDQPVNSTGGAQLLPCRQDANTCIKQVDFKHSVIQRGCTLAVRNCTDQQGQYSYTPVCKNMTLHNMNSISHKLEQCCCHGDGCNI